MKNIYKMQKINVYQVNDITKLKIIKKVIQKY